MDLTETERLSLLNQFRILAAVDDDEGWEDFAEILERGLRGEYYRFTEWLSDGLSEEECREVRDILFMFVRLQQSFQALDEPGDLEAGDVSFLGFGGNEETRRMGYVRFIRENLREFEHLRIEADGYNSHLPMLERYRAMLEEFENLDPHQDFSEEEIRRVVEAGVPST